MPLRDMGREQIWMLPPTLDELLPLDHPARFVAEFVDALDRDGWAELGVDIDGDAMGAPAYHPRALLSVWLYGFMTGVRSCRKLEAACRDQISYLWLIGWQRPDHNTLWRFYKGPRQAMRKLFERTVRTAVAMKLVDLAIQAVDGTKVVANASLNRIYDAEGLRGVLERVGRAIADLEAQNEAGEDAAAAHLPEELADKEVLREKVRQAMADLANQKRHKRINLTDRDARLMKGRQGIVAGYNAQAMVSPTEPAGGATGRAGLRNHQGAAGGTEVPTARPHQRGGRVGHVGHSFQPAHPVAGLALPRLRPATPRAESPPRFLILTAPVITLR